MMRRFLIKSIFSVFLVLFSLSTLASTNAATELSQLLSQYKTYQANFKQSTFYNENQAPQMSTGTLYLQRPGKFRWHVEKPMQQIVITNGDLMWVYDVELQQVTKQKLSHSQMNNPAVLLSGDVTKLLKNYDVEKVRIKNMDWYQLKPLSPQSNFLLVRMRFSQGQLQAIWLKNNLGQVSLFEFSNIQVNKPLSAKLFDFKAPPGVDVLQ